MSRSTYVYLVEYDAFEDRWPSRAFTVKYELVRWLKAQDTTDCFRVWRMHDGGHPRIVPVALNIPELLASPG